MPHSIWLPVSVTQRWAIFRPVWLGPECHERAGMAALVVAALLAADLEQAPDRRPDTGSRFVATLLGAGVGVAAPMAMMYGLSHECPRTAGCTFELVGAGMVGTMVTAPLLARLGQRLEGGRATGL